jgi:predicted membrane channel-forming protein YqfA (hemolysin III family)
MSFGSLLKRPSAFLPLLMSAAAFLLIIAVLATVGVTHRQDEGAPARIFQLLILLQLPIVGFFALKWWPRSPRPATFVLFLQVGVVLLSVATVVLLESHPAL